MLLKLSAGFLIFLSLGGLLSFLDEKNMMDLVLVIVFWGAATFLFRKSKRVRKTVLSNGTQKTTINKKTKYTFKVAGITKNNDCNEDIQKLIRAFVRDELEEGCEPYDGLTNKDILEDYYDDRVYEAFGICGTTEIDFIFEPDNPYDANAIKVIHEDVGHIGYVPKADNIKVSEIINNTKYKVLWEIVGGKYKYVGQDENDEDRVMVEKDYSYGVKVEIAYTPKNTVEE